MPVGSAPRLEMPDGHADPGILCLHTLGCSKMWDNLTCWPATPPGQVVVLSCPLIFKLFSPIQGKNLRLKGGGWSCMSGTGWSGDFRK